MTNILWLPAVFVAVGTGLLTWRAFQVADGYLAALTRRRLWLAVRQEGPSAEQLTEEVLFGIPSLLPYILVATVVGAWLGLLLLQGPFRFAGALAGVIPLLWKQNRIREGRQEIQREVADLVETLRLYLAFAPTPGSALILALAEGHEGILWGRLRRRRDQVYLEGPESVLRAVAEEVRSPELRRLLSRIQAAQAGTGEFGAALRAAADELAVEIQHEIEELVESAPTRLIMPIVVLLLAPLMVLVLNPPVQMFLDVLAGVGPSPLGG